MKRTMLVMALSLGAATNEAVEWRLGVFAGANVADLKIVGVPENEKKTRTAATFGGILALRPSDGWSIELRPGYTGGGAKLLFEGAQESFRANYLELPILVTRDLGKGERARPYLLASGAISRLSSARVTLPSGEQDVKKDFEGSDTSLRLGAGIRGGPKTSGQPFLEVEYSWGSKNLNSRRAGIGAGVGTVHNRGLQVRAGFTMGLNGK